MRASAVIHRGGVMAGSKEPIRFTLTPEQQAMVRQATGKNAEALELTVQELEERIAPFQIK